MSVEILKYIHKHVINMRNNEIDSNLRHAKSIDKNINKYVDNLIVKHPTLIAGVINRTQSGGTLLDEKTKQKLSKISAIFGAYNSIKIDDVIAKAKDIELDLDEIIQKINTIKTDNKLEAIQSSESLLNNLDVIKTDAQKFKDGIDINIEKSRLYIPITKPIAGIDKFNESISNIYAQLKQQITIYNDQIKTLATPDDVMLETLYQNIKGEYTKTKNTNENINEVLVRIIEANSAIEKIVEYDKNTSVIHKVMKLDELVRRIKGITGNTSDIDYQKFDLFRTQFLSIYGNYEVKKIKERDLVYWYNDNIDQQLAIKYDLPPKYFNGRFTQRISNNFLLKETNINEKLEVLRTMINDDENKTTELTSFVGILNPDFANMKKQSLQPDTSIPVAQRLLNGGSKSFEEVLDIFSKFSIEIELFYSNYEKYKKDIKKYNILQLRLLTHTLFQTLIVTNQLFETDHIVYNYINMGTLTLYERIIITIMNKIKAGDKSDKILYFKKYHYMTLEKLKIFIHSLISTVQPSDVIDIRLCTGEAVNRFLLLNYFKDILESYNETDMNAITIYSRINDIRDPILYDPSKELIKYLNQKMFLSDHDRKEIKNNPQFNQIIEGTNQSNQDRIKSDDLDTTLMYVSTNSCDNLRKDFTNNDPAYIKHYPKLEPFNQYKFTEVFDSDKFPDNGSISKYMTLDTQIAKGKGVAIMTYGYSGTGKTFTLFGNTSSGKQGMLQSTLDNITGLKWVKFRLFELYGHGLSYPHYWTSESNNTPRIDDIQHEIYSYEFSVTIDSLKLESPSTVTIEAPEIKNYIDGHSKIMSTDTIDCPDLKIKDKLISGSGYKFIAGNIVSNIFSNFDSFMDTVEEERKKTGRIRDTPNNIVSSRSVLIYDFVIRVGEKNVPFIILDLPGREEIIASYINPFLSNNTILDLLGLSVDSNETLQLKLLLSVMALNPIATPIFAPNIVFKFMNDMDTETRDKIFNEPLNMTYESDLRASQGYHDIIKKDGKTYISGVDGRGFTYFEEIINKHGVDLSNVIEKNYDGTLNIKSFPGFNYVHSNKCDLQYKALAGVHFINRLTMLKEFKILEKIFEKIIEEKINKKLRNSLDSKKDKEIEQIFINLQQSGFKGELLNNEKIKNKESLKKLIVYDYYLTPLEGIYINENIAGLIKFLASNEKMIPDEKLRNEFIKKLEKDMLQPQGLNFQYQQKSARVWLSNVGSDPEGLRKFYLFNNTDSIPDPIVGGYNDNTNLYYDTEAMGNNFDQISQSYESKKIFSFKQPLITNVLKPYVDEIKDYKVFYLFGNYTGDDNEKLKNLKCEHQYSLLENTSDFINVIVSPLKT